MIRPGEHSKRVLVVVRAAGRDRVAEALRAALGLGLRGDTVEVLLLPAARPALDSGDPAITRAHQTLLALGVRVRVLADAGPELTERVRAADAVEVWTP